MVMHRLFAHSKDTTTFQNMDKLFDEIWFFLDEFAIRPFLCISARIADGHALSLLRSFEAYIIL